MAYRRPSPWRCRKRTRHHHLFLSPRAGCSPADARWREGGKPALFCGLVRPRQWPPRGGGCCRGEEEHHQARAGRPYSVLQDEKRRIMTRFRFSFLAAGCRAFLTLFGGQFSPTTPRGTFQGVLFAFAPASPCMFSLLPCFACFPLYRTVGSEVTLTLPVQRWLLSLLRFLGDEMLL